MGPARRRTPITPRADPSPPACSPTSQAPHRETTPPQAPQPKTSQAPQSTPPQAPQAPRCVSGPHWTPYQTPHPSQAPQRPPHPSQATPTPPQTPQAPRCVSGPHWTHAQPQTTQPQAPRRTPTSAVAPCAWPPSGGAGRPHAPDRRGTPIRYRLSPGSPVVAARQPTSPQQRPPHPAADQPYPVRPPGTPVALTPTPQIQPALDRREVEIRRTAPGRNGSRQAVYATLTDAEPRSTAAFGAGPGRRRPRRPPAGRRGRNAPGRPPHSWTTRRPTRRRQCRPHRPTPLGRRSSTRSARPAGSPRT